MSGSIEFEVVEPPVELTDARFASLSSADSVSDARQPGCSEQPGCLSTAPDTAADSDQQPRWLSLDYWTGGDRPWYGSMLVSTAVHLTGILLLAWLWVPAQPPTPAPALDSRWLPSDPDAALTKLEQYVKEPPTAQLQSGGSSSSVNVFQDRSAEGTVKAPRSSAVSRTLVSLDRWVPEDLGEEVGDLSGALGDLLGEGIGTGDGSGSGDGMGGGFFGIKTEGKRFVYVVDRSTSMNHPYPGPAKTRFGRVQIELFRSVAGMSEEMQFFIIFFNNEPLDMPARGLQPASPKTKERYLAWMARVRTNGQTDPRVSLLKAIRYKPDVIYFLTDGKFSYRTVREVTRYNKNRVAIHTVCFGDRDGEKFLKEIAAKNGGTYHFVP